MMDFSGWFKSEGDDVQDESRIRVLIVDDNAPLAQLIALLLYQSGFEVQTVYSGLSALDAARSFRPHFVLLDIGLPGLDGYQVAEQLRNDSSLKTVIIIAISAYSPEYHTEKRRRAGFDYCLTKPVHLDDLLPLLLSPQA